ncbi:hypothetical protein [Aquabacterium humicola]|uniref:hypothetical protein n=1 Tax=Aquabacterium humicola TaxID=3237377 RepID=UPI002542FC6C|nr:hypothetical protein [Rubrivivax pictus]
MADLKDTRMHPDADANRDPLSGAPGAHPVGTGIGAAVGGMATGAAIGTTAGPVGTAIGAAAGAIVGGLAGKAIAEQVDPTLEDGYWRDNYSKRPYVDQGAPYDDYAPAYRHGVDAYTRYPGERFEDIEPRLASEWDTVRGSSTLTWERAKQATRDAWQRLSDGIERAMPGDSDRDGK